MISFRSVLCLTLCLTCLAGICFAQSTVSGIVYDAEGQTLPGAGVLISGTFQGASTDGNGYFTLNVKEFPITLEISYLGYEKKTVKVAQATSDLNIRLSEGSTVFQAIRVKADRISEKQREEALTVESIGIKAIQEAPAASFYESLGNLKGVDVTAASLGFRVVNTRGFNSTSPVRSLQIIDGVDNQSPGLNFSLGNFLGANDLDLKRVLIIAGASSAFYGPNAFNGVISMESKNPFEYPGLMAEVKGGERNLRQVAFRWADIFKNKAGNDKFAYKIGVFYMRALDWKADNYAPTSDSKRDALNPGGYDAVNIYGDESFEPNSDYSRPLEKFEYPGLDYFYRTGYREEYLVDYQTDNLKLNTSINYRIKDSLELIYAFNLGGGSTVYQGDNRYRLKNIWFWQHRIEISKKDKYFLRAYTTKEDAGETYDIVSTAFRLNETGSSNRDWNNTYKADWRLLGFTSKVRALPGYPKYNDSLHGSIDNWAPNYLDPFLAMYQDSLFKWHQQNHDYVNGSVSRVEAHHANFDSIFNDLTGRLFTEDGTRFFDKSALYHIHGEYTFNPKFGDIVVGANQRTYRPNSKGTILKDTGNVKITNYEYGIYGGIDKRWFADRIKVNLTVRLDKNQNFDFLLSPAASIIYKQSKKHTFRASFSSAVRNPTLADQYLYYDVGRATLLGNLDGFDSLITIESFNEYRDSILDPSKLRYYNVAPIRPEKARTMEVGYKGSLANNSVFIDASFYQTVYDDFIGYNIGLVTKIDPVTRFPIGGIDAYRVAANAREVVTTQGAAISVSYYFKKLALTGNYSWNRLNKKGTDDPIIPAYNTPENKFNLGWSGREIKIKGIKKGVFGFGINYKWIQGFVFEGSPQFTGKVPTYDMVDAQVNYKLPAWNTTFKLGASNLLGLLPLFDGVRENTRRSVFNNLNYQVYGGPYVGRLAYFSILVNIDHRKL